MSSTTDLIPLHPLSAPSSSPRLSLCPCTWAGQEAALE